MEGLFPFVLTVLGMLISVLLTLLLSGVNGLKKDVKALVTKAECEKAMLVSEKAMRQDMENQILKCQRQELHQ